MTVLPQQPGKVLCVVVNNLLQVHSGSRLRNNRTWRRRVACEAVVIQHWMSVLRRSYVEETSGTLGYRSRLRPHLNLTNGEEC